MNVRIKRGADIGNSLDHFLMVATLRLRTAAVPKKKNIVPRAPNERVIHFVVSKV